MSPYEQNLLDASVKSVSSHSHFGIFSIILLYTKLVVSLLMNLSSNTQDKCSSLILYYILMLLDSASPGLQLIITGL